MRCRRLQRLCMAALARTTYHSAQRVVALALATIVAPPQCAGHAAHQIVIVTDCAGLERAVPVPMTEDTIILLGGVEIIACDSVTTVIVGGPHQLHVSFDETLLTVEGAGAAPETTTETAERLEAWRAFTFSNVRFVVEAGAALRFGSDITRGASSKSLSFEGIERQDSDGGVLQVKQGASVTFLVPVHLEGNSVGAGYSGGALRVDGTVVFEHAADFERNQASGSGSNGGAVFVGAGGIVSFLEFASFEGNSSERGGALFNDRGGSVTFSRRSFFTGNTASGDGVTIPGDGGAVYAEEGSETKFTRKCTMHRNFADNSGGGFYNGGAAAFETSAAFQGNRAMGTFGKLTAAGGGHVFNRGTLQIKGDVSYRDGFSGSDGGAVYAVDGKITVLGGITSFADNVASGLCNDLYSDLARPAVRLTTTPTTTSRNVTAAMTTRRRRRTSSLDRITPCQPA